MTDLLLERDYRVIGLVRRTSTEPPSRMRKHFWNKGIQFSGDLTDSVSIKRAVAGFQPEKFYNLAAQSHVAVSWNQPELTSKVNYFGVFNCLEAVRMHSPKTRFYQASTSEMFGKVVDLKQSKESRFYPRSPYAVAKLAAHWLTINYRESYNLFACCGVLFNHEGPRRGHDFATHKIIHYVAHYQLGTVSDPLQLGNLNAKRGWGYAPDYVRAMRLMLQQNTSDDQVIGTGESHTVRGFVEAAFPVIDISIHWEAPGTSEVG